MKTLNETVSPHSRCRAGQGINGIRGTAFALAAGIAFAAFGATPSRAQTPTTHTVDLDFTLSSAQISSTVDFASNPGEVWGVSQNIAAIAFCNGDTIRGTVLFNGGDGIDNDLDGLVDEGCP